MCVKERGGGGGGKGGGRGEEGGSCLLVLENSLWPLCSTPLRNIRNVSHSLVCSNLDAGGAIRNVNVLTSVLLPDDLTSFYVLNLRLWKNIKVKNNNEKKKKRENNKALELVPLTPILSLSKKMSEITKTNTELVENT